MPFTAVIPTAEWSPEDPFEGTSFRVVRQLGRNAPSSRFLVRHVTRGQRFVATLLPAELARDEQRMERLLAELQLLAKLQHPNIASIVACERSQFGRPFLVSEWLQGRSLAEELAARGSLPWLEACELCEQLLLALAAAHSNGVLHGGITPSRLFLSSPAAGRHCLKILDFAGSLGKETDASSDVASAARVLRDLGMHAPSSELPAALRAFFARALHPEPELRFRSAARAAAALKEAIFELEPTLVERSVSSLFIPDTEPGSLKNGSQFLQYVIVECLGRGGHAVVYAAEELRSGREVAIKLERSSSAAGIETDTRTGREARALQQLRHPNVVQVFDSGVTADGVSYLVMELLRGCTLRALLAREGALPPALALELFLQVADALACAHAQHVIHRDLKPENVFVLPGRRAKVLDFGNAKVGSTDTDSSMESGLVHGTLQYISPEHLFGLGATERSDIYALGVMLYEALAGRHPYAAASQNLSSAALAERVATCVPLPLSEVAPHVEFALSTAVQRALHKQPTQRFANMDALRQALQSCLSRQRPADPAEVAVPITQSFHTTPLPRLAPMEFEQHDTARILQPFVPYLPELDAEPSRSSPGRGRRRATMGAVLGGLLGASGLFAYWTQRVDGAPARGSEPELRSVAGSTRHSAAVAGEPTGPGVRRALPRSENSEISANLQQRLQPAKRNSIEERALDANSSERTQLGIRVAR